jgi:hypothetical protein
VDFFPAGNSGLWVLQGDVMTRCEVAGSRGGTWAQNGVLLFSSTWGLVYQVPSSGGTPAPVTELNTSRGELSHRWPNFLPDGRHFFYSAANFAGGSAESASIYVADLDLKETKFLFHARSNATYTPGHILFVRDHTLMAQPLRSAWSSKGSHSRLPSRYSMTSSHGEEFFRARSTA